MMSISKFVPRLHSHFKTTAYLLHSSRVVKKKHNDYDYDLDSLIQWKNETTKVFGSVCKITKTGKIRKTKKGVGPQIEENLQILSTLSVNKENDLNSVTNAAAKKDKKIKNSKDSDNIADDSHEPFLCITHTYGQISCAEERTLKDNYFDIPDDVFMSSVIPHDAKQILKEEVFDHDGKECEVDVYYDRASTDNIVIPKLPPIPTSNSENKHKFGTSLFQHHAAESTVASLENKKNAECVNQIIKTVKTINSVNMIRKPESQTCSNTEPVSSNLSETKSKKTVRNSSSKSKQEISSDIISELPVKERLNKRLTTDIFIPKVKPVPAETSSCAHFKVSAPSTVSPVPLSQSSVFDSVAHLPIEPPASFEFIQKVSLFPVENSKWHSRVDADLFDAFQMDVGQLCLKVLPSVKTILSKTMPDLNRFFLNRWRDGLIKELGEEGFKKHQDGTIRSGLNLHANIMEWLSGKPVDELQIMPENEGHWSSLQSALNAISDVRAIEMEVAHSMLNYRGVFDCLARYKDLLCMIDWKTSKKPRPLLKNTYDDPIQIAAYIGALNANEDCVRKYGVISHGMVVVAYPDGSPAHIHVMNKASCEKYWCDWTERLYNFYQLTYTEKMAANRDKIHAKKELLSLGAT